ncbi:RNA polymerase sigma factor [Patescibacteria group bacterium]
MDTYVERQCIDKMKNGDLKQFLLLFDSNFANVYRYIYRRVSNEEEAEKMTRFTFLDALGRVQDTTEDHSYIVWLLTIAKKRVWDYLSKSNYLQENVDGFLQPTEETSDGDQEFIKRANKMFGKLSLEEREILRLKFFEEMSDADVKAILGYEQEDIGSKIYRVLKRAHFLLFGESQESQGIYFGELSGFLARIKDLEKIDVKEAFRLNLRMDLEQRIEKRDFAIDAELIQEGVAEELNTKLENAPEEATGSDDPAKVFVQAVQDMKEDEEREREKERKRLERKEKALDLFDRWRGALTAIPVILLLLIVGVLLWNFVDFDDIINFSGDGDLVVRGIPTTSCDIEVIYEGEFSDTELRGISNGISNRVCDYFDVEDLKITRIDQGTVEVDLDVTDWLIHYKFVQKIDDWRIKHYARTANSDQQSGEV